MQYPSSPLPVERPDPRRNWRKSEWWSGKANRDDYRCQTKKNKMAGQRGCGVAAALTFRRCGSRKSRVTLRWLLRTPLSCARCRWRRSTQTGEGHASPPWSRCGFGFGPGYEWGIDREYL